MNDPKYWRDVIETGSATFLVGAGISAPSPSRLPLAVGLVEAILAPVVGASGLGPHLSQRVVRALIKLRPEVIVDILLEHLGTRAVSPLPSVLRGRPNAWHKLLAASLGVGCCVVTTNFDTLIEDACSASGLPITCLIGGARRRLDTTLTKDPRSVLFKIHGSVGDPKGPKSLAFAIRQVGLGISAQYYSLLRLLIQDRPLIVLGYSGRDEFDILPALLAIHRTSDAVWVVHDGSHPPRPLPPRARRRLEARPALECVKAWTGQVHILIGDSARLLPLLRPRCSLGVSKPAQRPSHYSSGRPLSPPPDVHWGGHSSSPAVALAYGLVECRAFGLALRLFKRATRASRISPQAKARHVLAHAVALERHGTDLRAAQTVAAEAVRSATEASSVRTQILALDHSGVIARRRGRYQTALTFYDRALKLAKTTRCSTWLIMQIRSHRAIALEYLKRRTAALREHRVVAAYEKATGDLRGHVKSLNNMGIVYMNQRRFQAAIRCFEQSLALKKPLGDPRGTAQTLHNLGKTYYLARQYDKAESHFLASLRLRLGSARDRHGVAQSYGALGRVALKSGRLSDARHFATLALKAHQSYGDARGLAQARDVLRAIHRMAAGA